MPEHITETERYRVLKDLILVLQDDSMYINQKGYYQKCIDLLAKYGYYKDNESITELYNL